MIVHPECESKLTLGCNEPNNNTNNAKLTPGKQNLENFLLDKKASPKIPPQIYLTVHSGGFLVPVSVPIRPPKTDQEFSLETWSRFDGQILKLLC